MSGLKSIRIRRIAGLGGLVIVAALIAAVLAGPVAAHPGKGGHKDNGTNEAATFTFDVSRDIVGNVTVTKTVSKNQSAINIGVEDPVLVRNMDGFLVVHNVGLTGWKTCFAGPFTGSGVQVSADKNDPGFGWAGFWFSAEDKDGKIDIWYHLAVTRVKIEPLDPAGAVWPYWLPALNETATVTTVPGAPWKLQHSGGPGRKLACKGEGTTGEGTTGDGTGETLHFTILVTRTG